MSRLIRPALPNTGPGGRATIADVARVAHASKTSVSRYLGGERDVLSEELRLRIQRAIECLDYRPSQIARSLKGGRTGLIGMVVADIENPYSVAVLQGAEATCQQHGYSLMVCNTAGDPVREQRLISALLSYSVEGLILNTSGLARGLAATIPPGLPVVLVDRRLPGGDYDFVGLDNAAAMDMAVLHLAEQGFDDFALFLQPLRGVSTRKERAAGFRAALRRLPGCHGSIFEIEQADAAALDLLILEYLGQGRGRKAAIAANGLVTLRVVQSLGRLRLQMPRDLGLIGFDELEWSCLVQPGITTLAQPTHDLGASAVGSLLARLSGDRSTPHDTVFSGSLIRRGSSLGGAVTGMVAMRREPVEA